VLSTGTFVILMFGWEASKLLIALFQTLSRPPLVALFHQVSVTVLELEPLLLLVVPLAPVLLDPPLLQAASTTLVAAAATTAATARLLIIKSSSP